MGEIYLRDGNIDKETGNASQVLPQLRRLREVSAIKKKMLSRTKPHIDEQVFKQKMFTLTWLSKFYLSSLMMKRWVKG